MAYKFINNFETTLTSAITAAATSMTVANATGLSLASGEVYRLTIQNADASLYELVDVTAISGNILTTKRGKEATTAQAWAAGSVVLCGVTAEQLAQLNSSGGGAAETWYTATSNTIDIANGSKQKRTLSASGALTFTLSDGEMMNLLLNPATFTPTFTGVTWKTGSVESIALSAFNDIIIENISGTLYAYFIA